jgi:hypothetical protein
MENLVNSLKFSDLYEEKKSAFVTICKHFLGGKKAQVQTQQTAN